jgi:hypothetical protein
MTEEQPKELAVHFDWYVETEPDGTVIVNGPQLLNILVPVDGGVAAFSYTIVSPLPPNA